MITWNLLTIWLDNDDTMVNDGLTVFFIKGIFYYSAANSHNDRI
jgi:hypothetical protein